MRLQIFKALTPETRITAIPPTPGAVEIAAIVLLFISIYFLYLNVKSTLSGLNA